MFPLFLLLNGRRGVLKIERSWKKLELFLGMFLGTFLIAAGIIWLRDNRERLTHLWPDTKQTSTAFRRVQNNSMSPMQSAVPNISPVMDWSKVGMNVDWSKVVTNMPRVNIPPPQVPPIPQVRVPYIPPPPRIPYIPPPSPPMGFRR